MHSTSQASNIEKEKGVLGNTLINEQGKQDHYRWVQHTYKRPCVIVKLRLVNNLITVKSGWKTKINRRTCSVLSCYPFDIVHKLKPMCLTEQFTLTFPLAKGEVFLPCHYAQLISDWVIILLRVWFMGLINRKMSIR